jgi:hypothetical protein
MKFEAFCAGPISVVQTLLRPCIERSACSGEALHALQAAAWEVDKPGAAAHVRCGEGARSVMALTGSGMLQWWDTAMLKVGAAAVSGCMAASACRASAYAVSVCSDSVLRGCLPVMQTAATACRASACAVSVHDSSLACCCLVMHVAASVCAWRVLSLLQKLLFFGVVCWAGGTLCQAPVVSLASLYGRLVPLGICSCCVSA